MPMLGFQSDISAVVSDTLSLSLSLSLLHARTPTQVFVEVLKSLGIKVVFADGEADKVVAAMAKMVCI